MEQKLTKTLYLFGVEETVLRRELGDILASDSPAAVLSCCEGSSTLTLTAPAGQEAALADMTEAIRERMGDALYSTEEASLEQLAVALLREKKLTVATAESCTGGMIAARLTAVPGASAVFGTGVVSYSWDCKESLLQVNEETLKRDGAVSAAVAAQMARGVQKLSGADIGVSVTGEAGPTAAEDKPVGTVFIALADKKRTWVQEWHIPETERNAIRRQASGYVLNLLRRYLEAYPTVMAGGTPNRRLAAQRSIPAAKPTHTRGFLPRLLPWKGDSPRRAAVKGVAWAASFLLLVTGLFTVYRRLMEPSSSKQLQDSLQELYYGDVSGQTETSYPAGRYPYGMSPRFRQLYDNNKDIGGWIQIQDTGVSFPVMQYSDGFYKKHNFNRGYSPDYGQPYFDEDNPITAIADNRVLTVYGSNPGDGQMFSDLLHYRRLAFLQENPVINLNTLFADGLWQIFAVAVADESQPEEWDYAAATFPDRDSYAAYLEEWRERSLFHSDAQVTPDDRLLVLSVSARDAYDYDDARLVIAARLVDEPAEVQYQVNGSPKMPEALTPKPVRPRPRPTAPPEKTTVPSRQPETEPTVTAPPATEKTTQTGTAATTTAQTQSTSSAATAGPTTQTTGSSATVPGSSQTTAGSTADGTGTTVPAAPENGSQTQPEDKAADSTEEGTSHANIGN